MFTQNACERAESCDCWRGEGGGSLVLACGRFTCLLQLEDDLQPALNTHTHAHVRARQQCIARTHTHTDVLKRFVTKLNDLWQVICQFSSFDSPSGAAALTHLLPLHPHPLPPTSSPTVRIKMGSHNVFFHYLKIHIIKNWLKDRCLTKKRVVSLNSPEIKRQKRKLNKMFALLCFKKRKKKKQYVFDVVL